MGCGKGEVEADDGPPNLVLIDKPPPPLLPLIFTLVVTALDVEDLVLVFLDEALLLALIVSSPNPIPNPNTDPDLDLAPVTLPVAPSNKLSVPMMSDGDDRVCGEVAGMGEGLLLLLLC